MLQPRLDALPRSQRLLWPELRSTPDGFVLYGGTGLVLRLAHRESEDFDFFSSDPVDGERLLADVPYLDHADVVQRAENALTCLVDRDGPVRVSFFGGLALDRMQDPERVEGPGLLVASLLKALAFFDDGDLPEIPTEVRDRLAAAVRCVNLEGLPNFLARQGLLASRGSS